MASELRVINYTAQPLPAALIAHLASNMADPNGLNYPTHEGTPSNDRLEVHVAGTNYEAAHWHNWFHNEDVDPDRFDIWCPENENSVGPYGWFSDPEEAGETTTDPGYALLFFILPDGTLFIEEA